MDELDSIKKRRLTEYQQGDVRRACEMASVSSTIFQSAMRKEKINDLTDNEIKAIMAFKYILDERLEKKEELRKIL
jgi:hypothetical protein